MTHGLTVRQTQILKSLIEEYIETADPVGSLALEKKYDLGVSPATIRNEMAHLTSIGYLKQPHTSAGRVPTPKALKFYINQLMEERQLSVVEEVKAKEEVWDHRDDIYELVQQATNHLAYLTGNLAIGVLAEENKIWHSGYANLFQNPEFSDIQTLSDLFMFIEQEKRVYEMFFGRFRWNSPVEVLFGEDLDWPEIRPVGIAATHANVKGQEIALGVIGPQRLSYPTVIPVLRYIGNMLEEVTK